MCLYGDHVEEKFGVCLAEWVVITLVFLLCLGLDIWDCFIIGGALM